jgi:hypothetical protein
MANKKMTFEKFLEKCSIIHQDKYHYSKTLFTCTRDKIIIKCPTHGEFEQRASAHLDGQGCKKCRNENVRDRFSHSLQDFLDSLEEYKKDNLDFGSFVYSTDKTKGYIRCKKHDFVFETTPSNVKKSKHCCPLCARDSHKELIKNTKTDFINLSIAKHGDVFDYSLLPETFGSHDYVEIKCKKCCNSFWRIAYSHCNIGHSCPKCGCSKIHKQLQEFLTKEGVQFESNDRKILNGYELDLYIPDKMIAIECNGNYWHSEEVLKDDSYHLKKTNGCLEKNIQLLHFFEDEILYKKDIVLSIIKQKLKINNNKIYARKCTIKEIECSEKNDFLQENHIQGKDQSKIKLGLFYENDLQSVMTFGHPRYNDKVQWELIRFCNKRNVNVVGAASKLLKYFIKKYNPESIISYADRRISDGNLYEKIGFSFSHCSDPRYFYFPKKNPLDRLHRSNFTKSKIKIKFPNVDLSKTEKDIMKELEYGRIWDCGTKVYIWNKRNPLEN